MNAAEIARYAYNAGIRNQSDLQAAVAIALAESGGIPTKYNGKGRDQSYGLWQINMKPSEVGDRKSLLGISNNNELFDPAVNARAMYIISKSGKNWGPWTTWPLRATGYMPQAIGAAAGTIAKGGVSDTADTVTETVQNATDDVTSTAQAAQDVSMTVKAANAWISDRNNWVRVAKVGVGGVLIVGGAFLIVKPLLTSVAAREVSKVAGKALKGVKS